ncbi:synaptobrevin-domain-containing protein [Scheffersomyces xylosifermentans]|uniref:synaptobrevin-domain-containing protein n=1 Tax=Scheffersomyces xylosifermentans TaxID=1304137 RepID=UPI00315D65F0
MSSSDLHKHLIYATLTLNSTTHYTYENHTLVPLVNNLSCSEIVSQELGLINSSKTLVGSIPISSGSMNIKLVLYFMKKVITNSDGSSDLITVVTISHPNVNKTLILAILKKIMDKYIEFKHDAEANKHHSDQTAKLGEFKLYMNQIIKFEEMNYDSNSRIYSYGSSNRSGDDEDTETTGLLSNSEQINPNQLLLAHEEVDEVRQLMLENINKLLSRGDKINSLVDQTDRLTTSSSVFQKRAQQIKRKMWISKTKFILILVGTGFLLLYILLGSSCGFPLFDHCIHG